MRCPAPGLYEEIVLSNAQSNAAEIEYRIDHGPFPVSFHYARVTFVAQEEQLKQGGTLVTWTLSYTPYRWFGWMVAAICKLSFSTMLNTLLRSATSSKR